jgi:chorismate mutase
VSSGHEASRAAARLDELRERIARVDERLLSLLAERARLARTVGRAKREAGLPVLDPAREARVVRRAGTFAREHGLPSEELRALFWRIIEFCRDAQLNSAQERGAARATGLARPSRETESK